ncbi:DedA family protein [Paenibacillus alkaliterrae]|uniref:DedA family protein n=1 Tax=Paenibacillus alkaliterrae TaxID=320909 RepID=UPI001F43B3FC|nr:DedA family protein [Paenibacillus alkaliterrae]MCF2937131.1 DedA family protein [Paenibacillus alkaliterrae]
MYDLLLTIIEEIGYFALFLVLCLGLIGLPIPNEAVVMTGGALSEAGVLLPVPAFIMTCLGICSAMTFGYGIGRFASSRLSAWFSSKNNISKFVAKSEQLSVRYGGYAISISLCLPFLRHVTPYVMGLNRMPYKRFILFAYPSAFVWTLIYFIIGTIVGDQVQAISGHIYTYGLCVLYAFAAAAFVFFAYKYVKSRNRKKQIERPM